MKTEIINGRRVRAYDNGGKTVDRYTVAYMDEPESLGMVAMVAMDASPFHPQGFGQHTVGHVGAHLGKRIGVYSMPADCIWLVMQDLTPYQPTGDRACGCADHQATGHCAATH
jgi:hypothetical protein